MIRFVLAVALGAPLAFGQAGIGGVKGIDIIVKKPNGPAGKWTCWEPNENRPCTQAEFQQVLTIKQVRDEEKARFKMGPDGVLSCAGRPCSDVQARILTGSAEAAAPRGPVAAPAGVIGKQR